MLQLIMRSWKTCCIILDLIRSNDNVCDHNFELQYLRIAECITDIFMNSTSVVFIFILEQLIVSVNSLLIAVGQLQYISAYHYTDI